jgi:hypothetical protein
VDVRIDDARHHDQIADVMDGGGRRVEGGGRRIEGGGPRKEGGGRGGSVVLADRYDSGAVHMNVRWLDATG